MLFQTETGCIGLREPNAMVITMVGISSGLRSGQAINTHAFDSTSYYVGVKFHSENKEKLFINSMFT